MLWPRTTLVSQGIFTPGFISMCSANRASDHDIAFTHTHTQRLYIGFFIYKTHARARTHACVRAFVCVCMYVCVCVCVCARARACVCV